MHTEWLHDDEQRIWRQWLRAHTLLTVELGRRLQPHGLSLPDYAILVGLTDAPDGRLRMSELAHIVQWDRSRLSHHIKRMEQRGLVERENCSEDKRGAYLRITAAGQTVMDKAAPDHVDSVRASFFAGLTDEELATLDGVTARVTERLEG
ncbi:MarR family winged helix-turn-helix transcriptional regulator [Demetria terragena]|uniref:MarR family winged helix-turn-helix transcriptional regulator n=1 Tax=Demetria terragena TaxID=63959 RepID=UPI00036D579C|nr:MarR family transcriptional regulator [Demetria terragena]